MSLERRIKCIRYVPKGARVICYQQYNKNKCIRPRKCSVSIAQSSGKQVIWKIHEIRQDGENMCFGRNFAKCLRNRYRGNCNLLG